MADESATLQDTKTLVTKVVAIQGNPIFPALPNSGDGLIWNGAEWRNYPVANPNDPGFGGPFLPASGGPYIPVSDGPFLPLAGGVVTGNMQIDGELTMGGAGVGGTALVTTASVGMTLEQTGDELGGTSLLLGNRTGLNGALFTNQSLDLVDFAFQGVTASTIGTLRMDARTDPNGQFIFMLAGNTIAMFDSVGNLTIAGTLTQNGLAFDEATAQEITRIADVRYVQISGDTMTGPLGVFGSLSVNGQEVAPGYGFAAVQLNASYNNTIRMATGSGRFWQIQSSAFSSSLAASNDFAVARQDGGNTVDMPLVIHTADGSVELQMPKVRNNWDPVGPNDLVRKAYVDALEARVAALEASAT